jgi:hypothetical protein
VVADERVLGLGALGLGLGDEVANDLHPPVTAIRACLEAVLTPSADLSPRARDGLVGAALREAETLAVALEALEARLEVVDRAPSGDRAAT